MYWGVYLLAALVAAVILMQYSLYRRARRVEGQEAPDTSVLDGIAGRNSRKLYYFYARHCRPCKAMGPTIERLRKEHPNLIKLDVAEAPDIARQFGIVATPTFVLVEAGRIRRVRLGSMSQRELLAMLLDPE
ncbi:MAG TPA: thioredoxin family protein [Thiobacillaceae bacterium]|nr:thioredoxin family protein [Thiobacillaceae bacterium]